MDQQPTRGADQHYAELAEVAGGFIHEIKNHLGTLGLNLQLLAEDFHDPQSLRERRALERIHRLQGECQGVIEVANDFLRFARIKDLELAPTDLGRVVEEMIDFFGPTARAANIDLKSYIPADLPPVPLDREMFKHALLNLMLNAEQAMPTGGELTVEASLEADRGADWGQASDSGTSAAPPAVCVNLIDTGAGMSEQVRARVFQPFFSTKQGGTGLGLPTTRQIIEAHGGTIGVQSEVGRGTKFTIRLPACSPVAVKE
jgi:two-component system sensor histidine kinase HydH